VTGEETEKPIHHVFLFIGADPATTWLKDNGSRLTLEIFILTGSDVPSDVRRSNNGSGRALPLERSVHGVFAIGDVRSGSVARVGAAIGEGAVVVARLHTLLANGTAVSR
jgi:thioredoxin reductase (NADPH)